MRCWAGAARTSDALIQSDTGHLYLDTYLDSGVAHYQQKDYNDALQRLNKLIELDKRYELPRAEYVLGAVLEATKDLDLDFGIEGVLGHTPEDAAKTSREAARASLREAGVPLKSAS